MSHGITKHDTMLAVGDTPWHRMGTVLSTALATTADALTAAGLDWTIRVERSTHDRPIALADGGVMIRKEPLDRQVVIREDTDTILGTVGLDWRPVQNVDALKWFDRWVDTGRVTIETAGSLFGGRKVWALARLTGDPIVVHGDDVIERYVLIAHAHDGSMAIRCGLTLVRVVCANTLGAALRLGGLTKILHTARALERMENAADVIEQLDARLASVGDAFRAMAAAPVTEAMLPAFVGAVYEQTPEQVAKGRRLAAITERFESGVGQDLPGADGTVWGLYNALTEYETHHAGKSAETRADRNAWGPGAARLRRGFDVALVMARGQWTIDEVFGPWSEAAQIADVSHPDAAVVA